MLTKGQRDDFLVYFGTGAAALCVLGGLQIVAAAVDRDRECLSEGMTQQIAARTKIFEGLQKR